MIKKLEEEMLQILPSDVETEPKEKPQQAARPRFVKVYFNNGNVAVFPQDRVLFYKESHPVSVVPGAYMVNWNSVSWMREHSDE